MSLPYSGTFGYHSSLSATARYTRTGSQSIDAHWLQSLLMLERSAHAGTWPGPNARRSWMISDADFDGLDRSRLDLSCRRCQFAAYRRSRPVSSRRVGSDIVNRVMSHVVLVRFNCHLTRLGITCQHELACYNYLPVAYNLPPFPTQCGPCVEGTQNLDVTSKSLAEGNVIDSRLLKASQGKTQLGRQAFLHADHGEITPVPPRFSSWV